MNYEISITYNLIKSFGLWFLAKTAAILLAKFRFVLLSDVRGKSNRPGHVP